MNAEVLIVNILVGCKESLLDTRSFIFISKKSNGWQETCTHPNDQTFCQNSSNEK